jgi:hypothetical protein
MTRPPSSYTVLNPNIKPRTMARLLGLHDPDNGVVVCHPVPPRNGVSHLAHDVLYALGKRPSTPGWPRSPRTIERDVRRWLAAERVSDLLLVRADLFKPKTLEQLVMLAASADARRIWLIFDSAGARNAADQILNARRRARVSIAARARHKEPFTYASSEQWPSGSPWLARASAALSFPRALFDDVDAHMWHADRATGRWLAKHPTVTRSALERFMRGLVWAPDDLHRDARIMGAHSALLLHGLAPEIHDLGDQDQLTIATPTASQDAAIRRWSDPAAASLYALGTLTDLDDTTLGRLSLDQTIDTHQGVAVGGYLLRGAAASALRAHYAAMTGGRIVLLTNRLFSPKQLQAHQGPWGAGPAAGAGTIEIRVARGTDAIDLIHPRPRRINGFAPPAPTVEREAALIVRLLRLPLTRSLPLHVLDKTDIKAVRRLEDVDAVDTYHGRVFATESLRFSQFLSNAKRFLSNRDET